MHAPMCSAHPAPPRASSGSPLALPLLQAYDMRYDVSDYWVYNFAKVIVWTVF